MKFIFSSLLVLLAFPVHTLFAFEIVAPGTHQRLTEAALNPAFFIVELPNGKDVGFTLTSISAISYANKETDDIQTADRHFDFNAVVENFRPAQDRVIALHDEIVTMLDDPAFIGPTNNDAAKRKKIVEMARNALGGALHTIQDYYAHTNWIDKQIKGGISPTINAKLGIKGEVLYAPPLDGRVCDENSPGEAEPTSGYYFANAPYDILNICTKPENRCAHGNVIPQSLPGSCGINKDSVGRNNHFEALSVASDHTQFFTLSILREVLAKPGTHPMQSTIAVCQFLGIENPVATCLDDIFIVDIPFVDAGLEACVRTKATDGGWIVASEVTSLQCNEMGISNLLGLEYLKNLEALDVYRNNNIQDLSPLAGLVRLHWLQIFQNQVNSLEPLRDLKELAVLEANDNNIPSLEPLRDHQKLWWLTVADNPGITDITPIQNYTNLRVFNIANNPVQDISILANPNLATMTNLSLDFTAIDNSDLQAISGMSNMLALTIDGPGISDLSALSGMHQLERLHLSKNNIDADGPVPLQGLIELKYLVLNENRIWDVTNLAGMTHLIDLHLVNQEWPPGLDCVQQRAIREALPSTNVFVDDFWDDPDDVPDNGPVACNPNVVDIPFADPALEACIEAHATSQGWIKAGEVLHFVCRDMAISNIKGIEFLFNVVSVALDDNLINDITPMKDLVEITNLELFRNDISNMSPVSNMSKLNRFHIGVNSINSLEPLRHLTELVILDANDNSISSLEPVEGHSLYTWFTVAGNPITDISLIVNFPALQTLNISHTNISDISPVQGKTSLFHLDMAELQLTDADMPYLNQLTNLVRLALHMNQITDISPLQNMPDLDFVWLWQNDLVDISPLAPLQKIRVLDAGGNEIENVSALQNKPVLEWLWLPDNNVSDASPLYDLTQLDELNLREQNNHLNCDQQQNLVSALPAANVQVDGFWDDPNDDPDEGNIPCFP